ncbi:MAG: TolC family outer membrane protein [Holosporales bacterium]|jgi:outer membrane protein|nr:TolC family outer membrane protein [Holosporales bacterium]
MSRFLWSCFSIFLLSSDANAVTLEDAIKKAFKHNAKWIAAVLENQANQQESSTAMAAFAPSINATASMGRNSSKTTQQDNNGKDIASEEKQNSKQVGLSLKQSILNFSSFAQVNNTKKSALASKYNLEKAKQDTIMAVVEAYMNLWAAYEHIKIRIQNEKNLARDLEASRKRLEVGIGIRQDVAANEAAHAEATYHRIDAESKLAAAIAEYEKTVGEKPDENLEPLDIPKCIPDNYDKLFAEALRNNPSLKSSKYQTLAAEASIDIQRGSLLPSVALSADINRRLSSVDSKRAGASSSSEPSASSSSVMIELNVPLFACPSYSRIKQANLKAQAAQTNGLLMRQELEKACRLHLAQLKTTEAQIKQADFAVKSAEIAVDGMRQCLNVGTKSTTDVLQQEQKLLQSRQSRVEATKNHVITVFTLLSLTGNLNLETIAKRN